MAFDRTIGPVASPVQTAERLEFSAPAPQTILDRVQTRESQDIAPVRVEAPAEKKVTFADVCFATIMITLTVAAVLAGIAAALFLIGMGVALYVVPMIAAVGLGVTFFSAALLVFRKEIRSMAKHVAQKASRANDSADLFLTA